MSAAKKIPVRHRLRRRADGKPAEPTITLAEHAAQLAEAETAAHRAAMREAQSDAEVESGRRMADALERIAAGLAVANDALHAIETRLECEAVEVAVAVARKLAPALIAREPFAEISALASDCFRQLVAVAAYRRARQRRALCHRQGKARRHRARAQVSKAGWWCSPNPISRSAIAASNGPTAASTATAPRPTRRSARRLTGYVSARRNFAATHEMPRRSENE